MYAERGSAQSARALGCEIKTIYLTIGQYDASAIIEAPDDAAASKLALATGMRGTFHTETLRAYDEADALAIVQGLP